MFIQRLSRKWLLISLVLILVTITSACGNNENTDPAPEATKEPVAVEATPEPAKEVDKTPVTLKLATWVVDNPAFIKITDEFTKKFPWITVEWLAIGGGQTMLDSLTQAVAANDPIDVFWNTSFLDSVIQGFAEDLSPMIANDPEFQAFEFNEGINEPFQYEGKQFALSRGNDTFLIFYNKDLLNQYGLTAPKNDWTWEDLKEMAKKATDPAAKHYGIANAGLWFHFGVPTLPNANGHAAHNRMINEDFTKSVADDPAVLDDLQWMLDWVTKDEIMLNKKRMADKGIEGDMWANGQSLFILHVSPLIDAWKPEGVLKFDWDIAPMPKGTAKQVGMSFNNPMFMSKASKHKEAAWELMKFWAASVEGQKLLIDAGGTLPNSPNPELLDHFANAKVYEGLNMDALMYAVGIGETDSVIPMLGGNLVDANIIDWAYTKGYEEEVSAYDYFPATVEKLNKDLADLQAKY